MSAFCKALEIRRLHLGSRSEDVAGTLFGLGCAYAAAGENEAAVDAHRQCIDIRRSIFTSEDQRCRELGIPTWCLAWALEALGRDAEALAAHKECVAMNRQVKVTDEEMKLNWERIQLLERKLGSS